jgi:UDPglucose 6-dehydrogenase
MRASTMKEQEGDSTGSIPAPPAAPVAPMRIVVIGTGYVGLVGAACLAHVGHSVVAVDSDERKVGALRRGAMPIYEPGLQAIVAAAQANGNLRFVGALEDALDGAELVFIAVGTPADPGGATDLDAVTASAARIGTLLRAPATVVVKSTVPVGTTERLQKLVSAELRARGIEWRAPVVDNPEFLREGTAVHDFMAPDRIVVGATCPEDAAALLRAYAPLTAQGARVLMMAPRSAELSKYAANAMLAARISFINEIAAIAEASGADIEEIREGIGSDARIGRDFLKAGIGYGGSCFPKDVASLSHTAVQHAVRPSMLQAIEQVNWRQKRWAFDRLHRWYAPRGGLRGRRIALWGLAFKPGTDDMREAPSLTLIELLVASGAHVAAYDPVALANAQRLLTPCEAITWCASAAAAIDNADALVLATEWDEFRRCAPASVAASLRDRLVVDGRNVLDPKAWSAAGLQLLQVGRPRVAAQGSPAPQEIVPLPARAAGAQHRIPA